MIVPSVGSSLLHDNLQIYLFLGSWNVNRHLLIKIVDAAADKPALAKRNAPANPVRAVVAARVGTANALATLVNAESDDK
ncbi:hypothetical protein SOMG_02816 [Schizosaccharomyces osmophilus]|uniref:Uncharacterized protein n=1 Tax=Schizosaccharomyces osmophilus TaxID=2545709 RepID=A0AAF0AWV3_9SCHI|nr:uncharacterized protein SOMG_02816 [Schizosaccharomyces osmophilus]WBW73698.1 hypothetical protein SOMG_02816 [Schizosaccharomyces osmophilus]